MPFTTALWREVFRVVDVSVAPSLTREVSRDGRVRVTGACRVTRKPYKVAVPADELDAWRTQDLALREVHPCPEAWLQVVLARPILRSLSAADLLFVLQRVSPEGPARLRRLRVCRVRRWPGAVG
jgi:hypothetical protein